MPHVNSPARIRSFASYRGDRSVLSVVRIAVRRHGNGVSNDVTQREERATSRESCAGVHRDTVYPDRCWLGDDMAVIWMPRAAAPLPPLTRLWFEKPERGDTYDG